MAFLKTGGDDWNDKLFQGPNSGVDPFPLGDIAVSDVVVNPDCNSIEVELRYKDLTPDGCTEAGLWKLQAVLEKRVVTSPAKWLIMYATEAILDAGQSTQQRLIVSPGFVDTANNPVRHDLGVGLPGQNILAVNSFDASVKFVDNLRVRVVVLERASGTPPDLRSLEITGLIDIYDR